MNKKGEVIEECKNLELICLFLRNWDLFSEFVYVVLYYVVLKIDLLIYIVYELFWILCIDIYALYILNITLERFGELDEVFLLVIFSIYF